MIKRAKEGESEGIRRQRARGRERDRKERINRKLLSKQGAGLRKRHVRVCINPYEPTLAHAALPNVTRCFGSVLFFADLAIFWIFR